LHGEVEDLRASIMPTIDDARDLIGNTRTLIDNSRRLLARLAPKAESTVGDLAKVASGLQEQTVELESALQEVLGRVRFQVSRIDTMTTDGLDALDRAGNFVADSVGKPVRQLAGLVAAAKAIVESLRSPAEPRERRFSGDEDRFV
jgi:ElaB/YqjD/DUF883 family membrane-anchored ribosome-binding protein